MPYEDDFRDEFFRVRALLGGNIAAAADQVGVSRDTGYRWVREMVGPGPAAPPPRRGFTGYGDVVKQQFFTIRTLRNGDTRAAAREVNIPEATAYRWVKEREVRKRTEPRNGQERAKLKAKRNLKLVDLEHAKLHHNLSKAAADCLGNFAHFRRRYFGRISTPWQEEAAYTIQRFIATERKEFVVINAPPGSGKSTLFTHDIPAWLTVNNRSIRGLVGSASQLLANRYIRRLKLSFEASSPLKADIDELRLGVAFDAEATLLGDYGVFKFPGGTWSAEQVEVARPVNRPGGEKEPTWTAVGLETAYIGTRVDIAIWDDLVDPRAILSLNESEKLQRDWDSVAEKRLEPGGVCVLQGQRLGPSDIYRYNLDKLVGDDDDEPHGDGGCNALPGRKYHHVVYKAHDEGRCAGEHSVTAPYWPEGCLLDPRRLTWRELSMEMMNNAGNFLQVYQQDDADPTECLVDRLWVKGGIDPDTREIFPGCWDEERSINELPPSLGPCLSVASTDPSGTRSWACEWWLYDPATDLRHLMNISQRQMQASQFLDWDYERRCFTGVAEEWVQTAARLHRPITHWIVEFNAAQRYLLQNNTARRWARERGVTWVAHDTNKNRSDKRLGVEGLLRGIWREGKVRLPGSVEAIDTSRIYSLKLVDEVTKWRGDGKSYHNDCVMAQWFVEHNLERLKRATLTVDEAVDQRPSWLKAAM
jgi:transposase